MQTISFRAQSLNSGGGLINWLWMLVVAASLGFAPIGCDDSSSNNVNNNNDSGVDGDIDTVEDADADGDTDGQIPECITATGTGVQEPGTWQDGSESATIHTNGSGCTRAFAHSTTQFLRDNNPANPRMYSEQAGWPAVSSTNTLFDALYALALEEVRENSVPAIQDGAYNGGAPIECPAGGCFETGRLWKFVWTRDTSYAVDLALAALDPTRSRNSLEFKLSALRSGGGDEIIQDTGSGGSYPVSTDRVVWAIGAGRLLHFLQGSERNAFLDKTWEAVKNTIAQDRAAVFSSSEGLYLGEQSFLDWREQTYAPWTATDTVQIAMSQALSTNVGHLALLELGVELAQEKNDTVLAAQYQGWASDLRTAIGSVFFHSEYGLYGTFTPGFLDRAAVKHFDLLGSAFTVLHDVGDAQRQAGVVAAYPHLPKGPPVIWPQQKDVPIYHNRGIWPFVTAYWLRAARKVRNDAVVNHNVHSLIRGAAMNLSNMENFEAVTGLPWLDDGSFSGPVVNSQRQLWSVAAYVSMVHDIFFGLDTSANGIRFLPYITRELRSKLLADAQTLVLNNFPYRNRDITVVVSLPPVTASLEGAYAVGEIRLNGEPVTDDFLTGTMLSDRNLLEITLLDTPEASGTITLETDTTEYRKLFAPLPPVISGISDASGQLTLTLDSGGEATTDITYSVYRDGVLVESGLPGSTTSWVDVTADPLTEGPCYTVESSFVVTGVSGHLNVSQHARPVCYWGDSYERIATINATAFSASGGNLVNNYGYFHYESWGAPGDQLEVLNYTAAYTGPHLLQVLYGNGAGPFSTGITCVQKRVDVFAGATFVGGGYLVMPHLGVWDDWRDSNFVSVELEAGVSYRIVIFHDPYSINMSDFSHNALYSGTGGASGASHYVNIAQLKILSRVGTL